LVLEQTQTIGSNFINELKNIIIIFLKAWQIWIIHIGKLYIFLFIQDFWLIFTFFVDTCQSSYQARFVLIRGKIFFLTYRKCINIFINQSDFFKVLFLLWFVRIAKHLRVIFMIFIKSSWLFYRIPSLFRILKRFIYRKKIILALLFQLINNICMSQITALQNW
jgi:hypothetical protein